ncbi:phosphopantetheine-binding protein [Aeromonas cavernicola]|uniref:Acyl carrier protein n=1 Tax=Aeromonas cavernicola TaxID=1006623 RepID=A0A2H9U8X2_9GAMM|nr:phosphopantetheine-binding protein [Aeromonas cavernicola]PJG60477.1 acyl carrier protein [Aeromonas cavernicola]
MQSEMKQQVKNIITDCMAIQDLRVDDDMYLVDQLYLDSLDLIEIVLNLNEKFDIEIDGDEVAGFKTVSDIFQEVERLIAANCSVITEE